MDPRLSAALAGAFAVTAAPFFFAEAHAQSAATPAETAATDYVTAIRADAVQKLGITGAGVRVGILDSGITDVNGEFTGRVVGQYDTNDRAAVAAELRC